jgi:hypothetical protein
MVQLRLLTLLGIWFILPVPWEDYSRYTYNRYSNINKRPIVQAGSENSASRTAALLAVDTVGNLQTGELTKMD